MVANEACPFHCFFSSVTDENYIKKNQDVFSEMIPETKYAKSGDVHIAYQIFGSGQIKLVLAPGWASHIEYAWEEPVYARFLQRLGSFARVVWFDKRGTGLSDRVSNLPTLEQRMDDIRAVMDAVGFEHAVLFGVSESGSMSILFAATYPKRTDALILYGSFAKRQWSEDYPWAPTRQEREKWIGSLEKGWGGPLEIPTLAPSAVNDDRFSKWFATYGRLSVSPSAAVALARMNTEIDIRNILSSIHVPTLVLHRTGDRDVNVEEGRYLARSIPEAKFVELPGEDHVPWAGDVDEIADEAEEFLTGVRPPQSSDRVLATILLTDIVSSTEKLNELGDRRWKSLLLKHNEVVRKELAKYRGREVKTTGDGFLATFDGPARAIKCACSIRDEIRGLGMTIRAGLHTGECEVIGENDIGGVSVHIVQRVESKAGPQQVLVSSTVKDLVAGSGIQFSDLGVHSLKGIPGEWRLFEVKS
jgi:class 3 adenylate cyclase